MNNTELSLLKIELQEVSNEIQLEQYINDKIQKGQAFQDINIEFAFSEDYVELFQQYVDLYLYQRYQQLPFKRIEQLIGQIKFSPTLHHNYLILKILEMNFIGNEYTMIVHNIGLAQKLIGLCIMLINKKIEQITQQIIKLILPIIYRLPAYQISFHKIIEQFIEYQRYKELIGEELDFINLIINNFQYFQNYHQEIIVDYCFYISLKQKGKYKKIDPQYDNYQIKTKLTSKAVALLQELNIENNLFEKNEKYFKEIYNHLYSNDPLTIQICLSLLYRIEFNNRECLLIYDKSIFDIFLNNLKKYSQISYMIIKLLSKILLKDRSSIQILLLNKKFQEMLLNNFQKYFNNRYSTPDEIIPHLQLIEILFQENSQLAYNSYCPKVLMLFIKCLNLKYKQVLLLIIDIVYNILINVAHNSILSNKNMFRKIINMIDQSKGTISPEISIDDDPQLIILRILDLDITQQILRRTFFEKCFSCLNC